MEILNSTLDLNLILVKVFQFVTGISRVFRRTISSTSPYQDLTSPFTNLMLLGYKKLILTLASQMMMAVWKFPVIEDHPSITKHGGVCINYRNSLPLKILGIRYLRVHQF